jgi:hypothetical protein
MNRPEHEVISGLNVGVRREDIRGRKKQNNIETLKETESRTTDFLTRFHIMNARTVLNKVFGVHFS